MNTLPVITLLRQKFNAISICLNERGIRLWCATEAVAYNEQYGRGGVTVVHNATGISRPTIYAGVEELAISNALDKNIVRNKGGGRKRITDKYPELLLRLDQLVEPTSRGDPESSLRWTCKSVRNLSTELEKLGFKISFRTICDLLEDLEYSLQSNRKTKEGSSHIDRDAQFNYINTRVSVFQTQCFPVISVDTKKKENVGDFKNNGKTYRPKGQPILVNTHDFIDKDLGKVAPYGVYDIINNKGWVSLGIDHDTAEFAVNSIRTWWNKYGSTLYKNATSLMITADCGGSNGYRVRLWKIELQKLANEINMDIEVHHFPPGTSKWNKIEHRMFSVISRNWRGIPLANLETIIQLIGNAKTKSGLEIKVELDKNKYEKGKKISDSELEKINLTRDDFHGEWNYKISPQKAS
jgi:hypothetical protein